MLKIKQKKLNTFLVKWYIIKIVRNVKNEEEDI